VVVRLAPWPRQGQVWGPWPSTCSILCYSTLYPKKNTTPLLKLVFLLFLFVIFNLPDRLVNLHAPLLFNLDEREVPLPQSGLFSIHRLPWSRSKEELDEQL
jgi:hypothetical protein